MKSFVLECLRVRLDSSEEISLRGWEEAQGRIKMRLRISGSTRPKMSTLHHFESRQFKLL